MTEGNDHKTTGSDYEGRGSVEKFSAPNFLNLWPNEQASFLIPYKPKIFSVTSKQKSYRERKRNREQNEKRDRVKEHETVKSINRRNAL